MSGATRVGATPHQRSQVPARQLVIATVLAAATLAVVWLVAVPLGPVVCPAIMPAPTNCMSSYREGTAVVISAVTLVVYTATALLAFTAGRRHPAIVTGSVVVLALVLLAAWPLIGLLPGFPLA